MQLLYELLSQLEQLETEYAAQCKGWGTSGMTLDVVLSELERVQDSIQWIEATKRKYFGSQNKQDKKEQ